MTTKSFTTVTVVLPNGETICCKATTNPNSPYFLSGELLGKEIFKAAAVIGKKTEVDIIGYGKFSLYQKNATWLTGAKTYILLP